MKISIGSRVIEGPWGGGNLFVVNLKNYLIEKGHEVIHDLCDSNIDIILLTDPRSRKESSSTFNHEDIAKYKKYVNPNVVVIQRINECDERKGTNYINNFYLSASNSADHVVFVSSWLRKIYLNIGMPKDKTSVIMSGADPNIFNSIGSSKFKNNKIKFVTHHWSSHKNKGFNIYRKFDDLLGEDEYKHLEFTYIGNVPTDIKFKNIIIKEPLAGSGLANEIKKNHIYITASKNEPSGNHHIEAAQCGLPILYLNSGGIPEYCEGYGQVFEDNFEDALNNMISNYSIYKSKMDNYPFSSEQMCDEFFEKFISIKNSKRHQEDNINKVVSNIYLFKNKIQRLSTSFSLKQYIKKYYRLWFN